MNTPGREEGRAVNFAAWLDEAARLLRSGSDVLTGAKSGDEISYDALEALDDRERADGLRRLRARGLTYRDHGNGWRIVARPEESAIEAEDRA